MTQDEVAQLQQAQEEMEAYEELMRQAREEVERVHRSVLGLRSRCDHLYADGSSAIKRYWNPELNRCLLCRQAVRSQSVAPAASPTGRSVLWDKVETQLAAEREEEEALKQRRSAYVEEQLLRYADLQPSVEQQLTVALKRREAQKEEDDPRHRRR